MALKSDLSIDYAPLDPKATTAKTHALNKRLAEIMTQVPMWWEVGAEKYRQMRANGETPLPPPVVLEAGENIEVPSRQQGRSIPCRFFKPENGTSKGVFYHIHGGGFVLGSERGQDPLLKRVADHCQLTVLSVGYRLAPEHPYPAGPEDCYDVADWLVDQAQAKFGAPLAFMGGDSAGGTLAAVTLYHVLESRPQFAFRGLVLNFGAFNLLDLLPQAYNLADPVVLDRAIMTKFTEAYIGDMPAEEKRSKYVSPLYADMYAMKLPPALFTCGTFDCLLDDSVFMSTKWQMSGAEAILKLYPGAPHGFIGFPAEVTEESGKCFADIMAFINARSG